MKQCALSFVNFRSLVKLRIHDSDGFLESFDSVGEFSILIFQFNFSGSLGCIDGAFAG